MQNSENNKLIQPSEESSFAQPQKWWVLLGIGIGAFMCSLNIHLVNIALPTLVKSLHTSFTTIQWVVISYSLMITVTVLGAANLGDMFGKKLLYSFGMLLFIIGSLSCGLAPNVGFLIAFRGLQGMGAAFISSLGIAIITEVFPKEERGQVLGIISGISAVAVALGSTVGGLVVGILNWRLVFWINVPFGLVASSIVLYVLPRDIITKESRTFDVIGMFFMTLTLTCFALAMTLGQQQGFGSIAVLILLIVAANCMGCFLLVETRQEQPLLNLRIFRSSQLSLSALLSWIAFILLGGFVFITPFFLELVKHYTPQQVGVLLIVFPISIGLVSPISGTLSDRFGESFISLIGLVCMAFGFLGIGTFDANLTILGYILRVGVLGIGFGMFLSPNNSAIIGAVPKQYSGVASGLLSLTRTLAGITSVPILSTVFWALTISNVRPSDDITNVLDAPVDALVFGIQNTFRLAVPLLIVLIILAAFRWRQEKTDVSQANTSSLNT